VWGGSIAKTAPVSVQTSGLSDPLLFRFAILTLVVKKSTANLLFFLLSPELDLSRLEFHYFIQ